MINLVVLAFIVCLGASRIDSANYTAVNDSFMPYGGTSVVRAAGTVFFSFIGFDQVGVSCATVA